ncbi:MAG: hypothetical protein HDQ87_03515 [Clostridia bacterium]|nr:hypothetical protein [Clostridia bacterium]
MFRNIHKKYIALNVVVLTLILAACLVLLNYTAHRAHAQDTRELLTLILRTGGEPENALAESRRVQDAGETVLDTESSGYFRMRTSSYFLVQTSGSAISAVDVRRAVEVNEEDARSFAVMAIEEGRESGRVGRYAYQRQLGPTGSVYAFLDVSSVLLAESRLLVSSVAIGALAEALILVFIGFMAVRQVRPAEQLLEASRDIMDKSAQGMEAGAAFLISAYRDRGSANASPALREGSVLAGIATDLRGVADAIDRTERPQAVNVSPLLLDTVEDNAALLEERGLAVHTVIEEDAVLRVRPEEIRALFEILVVNAGENAEPGGDIFVDLLADGSNAGIIVRYTVAELPDVDPDMLLSGERSGGSEIGGGLYAAGLLARLNHGVLGCEYLDPPAVCLTVRFRRRLTGRQIPDAGN